MMRQTKHLRLGATVVVGAVMLLVAALPGASRGTAEDAASSDQAVRPSKLDLTPENASTVLALARPSDSEWRHLRVNWLTDVVAARKKAAAEDKPIIICYTGGAGYNEPLGVC